MNFTEPSKFQYTMSLKLGQVPGTELSSLFPNVEDVLLNSKEFETLEEAADSSNIMLAEVAHALNTAVNQMKYKLVSEVNPLLSGKQTVSKDWDEHEMVKMWIVEGESLSGTQINAIARSQLMQVFEDPVPVS